MVQCLCFVYANHRYCCSHRLVHLGILRSKVPNLATRVVQPQGYRHGLYSCLHRWCVLFQPYEFWTNLFLQRLCDGSRHHRSQEHALPMYDLVWCHHREFPHLQIPSTDSIHHGGILRLDE